MADSSRALHEAIYASLSASSGVTDVVGDHIYDNVPWGAEGYPFVQISMVTGAPYDGVDLDGFEAVFRVDVWDRLNGHTVRAQAAAKAIYDALHNQDLAVTGFTFVNCRLIDQRLTRDDDSVTVEIMQRFRCVTSAI